MLSWLSFSCLKEKPLRNATLLDSRVAILRGFSASRRRQPLDNTAVFVQQVQGHLSCERHHQLAGTSAGTAAGLQAPLRSSFTDGSGPDAAQACMTRLQQQFSELAIGRTMHDCLLHPAEHVRAQLAISGGICSTMGKGPNF